MKKEIIKRTAILSLVFLLAVPSVVFADYGPIVIDGYYDDWEDKPHTEMYKGNASAGRVSDVSLFRDVDNVYIHVIFADRFNQSINSLYIDISTNLGRGEYELSENPSPSLSTGNGMYDGSSDDEYDRSGPEEDPGEESLEEAVGEPAEEAVDELEEELEGEAVEEPEEEPGVEPIEPAPRPDREERVEAAAAKGFSGIRSFSVRQNNSSVGSGYMTLDNGKLIEAEFYIPLSSISSQPDGITDITMGIKSLGNQKVSCVGAGTGYLMLAILAVIATASAAGLSYRRKLKTKK